MCVYPNLNAILWCNLILKSDPFQTNTHTHRLGQKTPLIKVSHTLNKSTSWELFWSIKYCISYKKLTLTTIMLKMMGQELSLIADDDLSINSSNIFDVSPGRF